MLTPDLAAATFSGDVEIDVTIEEPTSIDHPQRRRARDHLRRAERRRARRRLRPLPHRHRPRRGRGAGHPHASPSPSSRVPATLHLVFTGILNDKLHGFYRSTFTDDDGVEHIIATTQMESTDARRAFPCWDEPDAQGHLRGHPGGRRRTRRLLQRIGRRGGSRAGRQAPGPIRHHHDHVHLPGRVHRRPARGHRPARRRRRSPPHRPPTRPRAPHRVRPRPSGPMPSASSPTTSASPTRPTSSTWWPSPTSPSERWRTSGA